MMIKIALCDDNEIERNILGNIIKGTLNEMGQDVLLLEFSSGEKLLRNFSRGDYDLIFLDIQMKQLNGIETGMAIRHKDAQVEIVYATCSDDYLKEGFDVHALAYILKPYEVEKVKETLTYFNSKHKVEPEAENEFLEVTIQQKNIFIRQRDIYWIESMGRVVNIYSKKQVYRVYARLNDIEKELDNSKFLRCNQSYIVNILWVKDVVDYDFYLPDNKLIPIRKRDRKEIVQKYYNKRNETEDVVLAGIPD